MKRTMTKGIKRWRVAEGANQDFFTSHTFADLVRLQGVEPINDIAALAGGWPDDQDLDAIRVEIYKRRW